MKCLQLIILVKFERKYGDFMIKLLGTDYMNDKETAQRYGYSTSWLAQRRSAKLPPNYIKINGKILYETIKTDEWFKKNIINTDY